jgi:hypothetical protein
MMGYTRKDQHDIGYVCMCSLTLLSPKKKKKTNKCYKEKNRIKKEKKE